MNDVRVLMNAYEREPVSVNMNVPEYLKAPVKKGDAVGTANVCINGTEYGTIPLTATENAERHDFKTSMEKIVNAWFQLNTRQDKKAVLPEF
jgi:hypothetical protein